MATPIDKVQNRMSRVRTVALMVFIPTILTFAYWTQNAFLAFTGIVAAVAAWTIMKPGGIFEVELDEPKGDPSEWTRTELKTWLRRRGLKPEDKLPREELEERVRINMRRRDEALRQQQGQS